LRGVEKAEACRDEEQRIDDAHVLGTRNETRDGVHLKHPARGQGRTEQPNQEAGGSRS